VRTFPGSPCPPAGQSSPRIVAFGLRFVPLLSLPSPGGSAQLRQHHSYITFTYSPHPQQLVVCPLVLYWWTLNGKKCLQQLCRMLSNSCIFRQSGTWGYSNGCSYVLMCIYFPAVSLYTSSTVSGTRYVWWSYTVFGWCCAQCCTQHCHQSWWRWLSAHLGCYQSGIKTLIKHAQ